jgi:Wiskott-Aldrich syndrome protein
MQADTTAQAVRLLRLRPRLVSVSPPRLSIPHSTLTTRSSGCPAALRRPSRPARLHPGRRHPSAQEGARSSLLEVPVVAQRGAQTNSTTAAAGGAAVGLGAGVAATAAYSAPETPTIEEDPAGGGDLAATLAAALSARKGNMGDSDDEESDDGEWDD